MINILKNLKTRSKIKPHKNVENMLTMQNLHPVNCKASLSAIETCPIMLIEAIFRMVDQIIL